MYESCLSKQNQIKALFSACSTEEAKYQKIIEMGREMAPLDSLYKIPENKVQGCQSIMHMRSWMENSALFFHAESEALISSGLAAILIKVYSGETPETILKCPPQYLEELGLSSSLTPNRASGLYSIHLRMKQEALKFLIQTESQKK